MSGSSAAGIISERSMQKAAAARAASASSGSRLVVGCSLSLPSDDTDCIAWGKAACHARWAAVGRQR